MDLQEGGWLAARLGVRKRNRARRSWTMGTLTPELSFRGHQSESRWRGGPFPVRHGRIRGSDLRNNVLVEDRSALGRSSPRRRLPNHGGPARRFRWFSGRAFAAASGFRRRGADNRGRRGALDQFQVPDFGHVPRFAVRLSEDRNVQIRLRDWRPKASTTRRSLRARIRSIHLVPVGSQTLPSGLRIPGGLRPLCRALLQARWRHRGEVSGDGLETCDSRRRYGRQDFQRGGRSPEGGFSLFRISGRLFWDSGARMEGDERAGDLAGGGRRRRRAGGRCRMRPTRGQVAGLRIRRRTCVGDSTGAALIGEAGKFGGTRRPRRGSRRGVRPQPGRTTSGVSGLARRQPAVEGPGRIPGIAGLGRWFAAAGLGWVSALRRRRFRRKGTVGQGEPSDRGDPRRQTAVLARNAAVGSLRFRSAGTHRRGRCGSASSVLASRGLRQQRQ